MATRKLSYSRCQVCRHEERWRIELLRAGGATLDALASKFGIQRDSIHRHYRDHVSDEMKAGYLAGPVQLQELAAKAAEQGSSVLDHLHAVRCVLMGQLSLMTEGGDARGAGYIGGQLVKVLETIAKISGELGDLARSTNLHITNNFAILQDHPAFAGLQAGIIRALGPFPDARAAVVAALRDLDHQNTSGSSPAKVIEHQAGGTHAA